MRVDRGEHLVRVAAEHGRHAGRFERAGGGHLPAADAGEGDRRLGGQHPGERGGAELADAVAGGDQATSCSGSCSAASSAAATSSGWVRAVSLISSASASVPRWTRSTPASADHQRRRASAPGRSSQGVRKPGFWEPWPGREYGEHGYDSPGYPRVALCRRHQTTTRTFVRVPTKIGEDHHCVCAVFRDAVGRDVWVGTGERRPGRPDRAGPTVSAIRRANASRGVSGEKPVTSAIRLAAGNARCSGARTAPGRRSPARRRRRRRRPASPAARRRRDQRPVHVVAQHAGGPRRRRPAPAPAAGPPAGTGRGAAGQAGAARNPASAARADSRRLVQRGYGRTDHDRPVAERGQQLLGGGQRVGRAAEHDHQPVAVHPADHLDADAGGPAGRPCAARPRPRRPGSGRPPPPPAARPPSPARRPGWPARPGSRRAAARRPAAPAAGRPRRRGTRRPGRTPGRRRRRSPGRSAAPPRAAAAPRPAAARCDTCSSTTSMVTLISATVCWRLIERASARGAASKTSSETSCVLSAVPPPSRSHSHQRPDAGLGDQHHPGALVGRQRAEPRQRSRPSGPRWRWPAPPPRARSGAAWPSALHRPAYSPP